MRTTPEHHHLVSPLALLRRCCHVGKRRNITRVVVIGCCLPRTPPQSTTPSDVDTRPGPRMCTSLCSVADDANGGQVRMRRTCHPIPALASPRWRSWRRAVMLWWALQCIVGWGSTPGTRTIKLGFFFVKSTTVAPTRALLTVGLTHRGGCKGPEPPPPKKNWA